MSPIICVIDGNIGAGKSTLLSKLRNMGFKTYPEPINEWETYLNMFYDDPKRWSFTVQMAILMSLEKQKTYVMESNKTSNSIVFIERSPESSMIFTGVQRESGYLTTDEYNLIVRLYEKVRYVPDYMFYLDVPPTTCLTRVQTRGRANEKNIDEQYLRMLHDRYKTLNTIPINGTLPKFHVVQSLLSRLPCRTNEERTETYTYEIERYRSKYHAYKKAYRECVQNETMSTLLNDEPTSSGDESETKPLLI